MFDQWGNDVGPGYIGGNGDTVQSLSLANGGNGSGSWSDPGTQIQFVNTQNDLNAIRNLMATQNAGYLTTGTGSLSNGADMSAYLPQLMTNAGISPTQGILNAYQGLTGQQYQPGSQISGFNPNTGAYSVDMSGVNSAINSGLGNIGNQIGTLNGGLSSINSGLSGINSGLSGISSGLSSLGGQFNSGFSSLADQFNNGLSGIGNQVGSGLSNLGSTFNNGLLGINNGLSSLGSQFGSGFSALGSQLSGFGTQLNSYFDKLSQPNQQLDSLNNNFSSFLDMYKKQFDRKPYEAKAYEKSPYVDQMVQAVKDQVNDNWKRSVQPTISSNAQAVGGYGGSRQGVVEANALNDINRSLAAQTANIYQTDYENQQNRNLQEYAMNNNLALGMGNLALNSANSANNYNLGVGNLGLGMQNSGQNYQLGLGNLATNAANSANNYNLGMGNLGLGYQNSLQNYDLGLGNLGLGYQNSTNNFYTAQRGQDLQQMGLGMQMVNNANQGFYNQGQGTYNAGSTYQQAPWSSIGNFANTASPFTGFGTTTGTANGSTAANTLGGALGGAQLFKLFS